MRTSDELVAWYATMRDDIGNWRLSIILPFLSAEQCKPWLKDGADVSGWDPPEPIEEDDIKRRMAEYMVFAWEKCIEQRGISAHRSIVKFSAWCYILGDDEAVEFLGDSNNDPSGGLSYGEHFLLYLCERFDFPVPEEVG